MEEAGAEAVLCLQSSLCHEALQIDWPAIRARALERGVVIVCVAVRDFDHNDQVRETHGACSPPGLHFAHLHARHARAFRACGCQKCSGEVDHSISTQTPWSWIVA